jgi:hypothetical protein
VNLLTLTALLQAHNDLLQIVEGEIDGLCLLEQDTIDSCFVYSLRASQVYEMQAGYGFDVTAHLLCLELNDEDAM